MSRESLRERIDAIEAAYEFFLAFAAQGTRSDRENPAGGQLRDYLGRTAKALDGLATDIGDLVEAGEIRPAEAGARMTKVIAADARATMAAVDLVAGQEAISSQLIDNLNATIHIRALLTDLFLLDELLGKG